MHEALLYELFSVVKVPESMVVFGVYTQSLCQFECAMKQAAELCLCIPWKFPSIPGQVNLKKDALRDSKDIFCF
jgi:hypothetical protein